MGLATRSALLLLPIVLAGTAIAQNAPANPPVAGTVASFDGKTLTIKDKDGKLTSAALAPNVNITFAAKRTLADIKPGDFIASVNFALSMPFCAAHSIMSESLSRSRRSPWMVSKVLRCRRSTSPSR